MNILFPKSNLFSSSIVAFMILTSFRSFGSMLRHLSSLSEEMTHQEFQYQNAYDAVEESSNDFTAMNHVNGDKKQTKVDQAIASSSSNVESDQSDNNDVDDVDGLLDDTIVNTLMNEDLGSFDGNSDVDGLLDDTIINTLMNEDLGSIYGNNDVDGLDDTPIVNTIMNEDLGSFDGNNDVDGLLDDTIMKTLMNEDLGSFDGNNDVDGLDDTIVNTLMNEDLGSIYGNNDVDGLLDDTIMNTLMNDTIMNTLMNEDLGSIYGNNDVDGLLDDTPIVNTIMNEDGNIIANNILNGQINGRGTTSFRNPQQEETATTSPHQYQTIPKSVETGGNPTNQNQETKLDNSVLVQPNFQRPGAWRRYTMKSNNSNNGLNLDSKVNCPYCDKKYNAKTGLAIHVGNTHQENYAEFLNQKYVFICPVCKLKENGRARLFRNVNSLKEHVRKKHENMDELSNEWIDNNLGACTFHPNQPSMSSSIAGGNKRKRNSSTPVATKKRTKE